MFFVSVSKLVSTLHPYHDCYYYYYYTYDYDDDDADYDVNDKVPKL